MNRTMALKKYAGLLLSFLLLGAAGSALAQTPQDNWYLEQTLTKTGGSYTATNGGLSSPYGVAIGLDGRIYVGDEGYGRIQVYLADGTYSFSITNGFGGGQNFSQPRGMITDKNGNLFVADYGNNCVYQFATNGSYLRKFGSGAGSGNGQLSGVMDVAVAANGSVYVLEKGNRRISIFASDGTFLNTLLTPGQLDGQLANPIGVTISPNQTIYICEYGGCCGGTDTGYSIKSFNQSGVFLAKQYVYWAGSQHFGCASVRADASGLIHVIRTPQWNDGHAAEFDYSTHFIFSGDFATANSYNYSFGNISWNFSQWPCHAVAPDGSMIVCGRYTQSLMFFRHVFRDQWSPPRNAIPMPAIVSKQQRSNSPLVDIDYQVTDMDNTNVSVAMLIFTNSSSTATLGSCIRTPTLVEGTATNRGANISANQIHRLTWNAGADWAANLGNYRVAILARDSRTNLLDIHYLQLPAGNGMPALKISSSPLNTEDFMQVWWWLLATNDTAILLATNAIYGTSGPFNTKQLCTNGITTSDGRNYLYAKMNVREATTAEVLWAKQGNMPVGSSPNQWTPTRQVSGRPKAVNEWGFDTGSWDTNTCKWVVPLP